jgi:glycosyltransferase involved in cell wall biosynthesis
VTAAGGARLRVLHVGPLPPTPSGVADYAAELVPHLARRVDLTLAVADDAPATWVGETRPVSSVDPRRFDALLYQIGNHRFHGYAIAMLQRWPGVVVLHEAVLHHLFADLHLSRGRAGAYVREAGISGGADAAGRALATALGDAPPAWYDQPMLGRVARAARGLIVHSRQARAATLRACPGASVEVIHLASAPPVEIEEPDGPFTVGVFGGLTPEKRVRSVVRAVGRLADARLLLVGEPSPSLGLGELPPSVTMTGRVEADEMERLIGRCHVCVQLRWPTAGEASAATLRVLRRGRPTIVSDCGWFAELPNDAIVPIPAGLDEADEVDRLTAALRSLAADPERRRRLARAARAFVGGCGFEPAAEQYAAFLAQTATIPSRSPGARP